MSALRTWRESLDPPTLDHAATLIGVSGVHFMRLERGERSLKPSRAAEVSRITGIPREELRPDIFGQPEGNAA